MAFFSQYIRNSISTDGISHLCFITECNIDTFRVTHKTSNVPEFLVCALVKELAKKLVNFSMQLKKYKAATTNFAS